MRKHKHFICIFIVVVISYLATRDGDIQPEDLEITRIEKIKYQELTPKQVRREIDLLIYALDHAYAGKYAYEEAFFEMRKQLDGFADEVGNSIANEEYAKKISSILEKFPDGHLSAYSTEEELKASRQLASTPENQTMGTSPVNGFKKKISGKNVFVIELPTFEFPERSDREKISNLIDNNLNSQAMVFDLRGNTGGRLKVPMQIASILWGEVYRDNSDIQYYPMPIKMSGSISSPAAVAIWDNLEVILKSDRGSRIAAEANKSIFDKILTYNEYEHSSLRKKLYLSQYNIPENVEREENTLSYEDSHFKEMGYKKPIFLIVDQKCASACEILLESLEAHPYVKVIGNITQGASQFGHVGALVLPMSHLRVTIATSFRTYKDNRVKERVGYTPGILLEKGEDPYSKIRSILK